MNNVKQINGLFGFYDGRIRNSSVCYGRNAMHNFENYTKKLAKTPDIKWPDFSNAEKISDDEYNKKLKEFDKAESELNKYLSVPIKYEIKYTPKTQNGGIDKMALMGAAYEDMDKQISVPVEQVTKGLQDAIHSDLVNANSLDINSDGQIDISEYATTILASDMLSKDASKLDAKNITGIINNQGHNALLSYMAVQNYAVAKEDFTAIHKHFNLNEAQKEFQSNLNNLV